MCSIWVIWPLKVIEQFSPIWTASPISFRGSASVNMHYTAISYKKPKILSAVYLLAFPSTSPLHARVPVEPSNSRPCPGLRPAGRHWAKIDACCRHEILHAPCKILFKLKLISIGNIISHFRLELLQFPKTVGIGIEKICSICSCVLETRYSINISIEKSVLGPVQIQGACIRVIGPIAP